MIFEPHSSKQEEAILSTAPITLCCTGIQWGKTTVGAVRMLEAVCTHTAENDVFLVTAPTYKIMRQSTLPAFLKLVDGLGTFSKVEGEFRVHNGGTIYFRTGTEPDSIVGMTNVRHVWCDEAGKYSSYFWANIQGRASFRQAPITITTSPYSMNWVYKDLIRPVKKNKRDDVFLIQATSKENPYFPDAEYEQRKKTMDPRRFNAIYGGQFERMEGLVYDCFSEANNIMDPCNLPSGTRIVAGIDWGYTDPFVLVVRAITPDGYHWQVSEYYKPGLTIMDMVKVAKQKKQVWDIERFYCDPSQPGYIEEFNRAGLTAVGANNDIRKGIDIHYELIKTGRYKIFDGSSPNTVDEIESYHWPDPKDLKPDQDSKDQNPVKQYDHAMDTNRYISVMTFYTFDKKVPKDPMGFEPSQETHDKRIKRLQSKRRMYEEDWS